MIVPVAAQSNMTEMNDMLVYVDTLVDPPQLTLYDPIADTRLVLGETLANDSVTVVENGYGRIAYVANNDIWILDLLTAPNNPIQITFTPDEREAWLSWVDDGQILEFYILPILKYQWDGAEVEAIEVLELRPISREGDNPCSVFRCWSDIVTVTIPDTDDEIVLDFPPLEDVPLWYDLSWLPDNTLFITVGFDEQEYIYRYPSGATQIFYYDGNTVQEVIRPFEGETFLVGEFSPEGQITFLVDAGSGNRQWYVWDGQSFTENGVPDATSMTPILTSGTRISDLEWLADGRLLIVIQHNPDEIDIDRPVGHNAFVYLWQPDEMTLLMEDSFIDFQLFANEQGDVAVTWFTSMWFVGITVFNAELERVTGLSGGLSSWSADGYLAYCSGDDLLVWNRETEILLSRRTEARWLSMSFRIACTTG